MQPGTNSVALCATRFPPVRCGSRATRPAPLAGRCHPAPTRSIAARSAGLAVEPVPAPPPAAATFVNFPKKPAASPPADRPCRLRRAVRRLVWTPGSQNPDKSRSTRPFDAPAATVANPAVARRPARRWPIAPSRQDLPIDLRPPIAAACVVGSLVSLNNTSSDRGVPMRASTRAAPKRRSSPPRETTSHNRRSQRARSFCACQGLVDIGVGVLGQGDDACFERLLDPAIDRLRFGSPAWFAIIVARSTYQNDPLVQAGISRRQRRTERLGSSRCARPRPAATRWTGVRDLTRAPSR